MSQVNNGAPSAPESVVILPYQSPVQRVVTSAKHNLVIDIIVTPLASLAFGAVTAFLDAGDFSHAAEKGAAVALGTALLKTGATLYLKYVRAKADEAASVTHELGA